jgi:hypothetical protein
LAVAGTIGLSAAAAEPGAGTEIAAREPLLARSAAHALGFAAVRSGSRGTAARSGRASPVLLRSFTGKNGAPCREYRQIVSIAGNPVSALGTVCRQADGRWRVSE